MIAVGLWVLPASYHTTELSAERGSNHVIVPHASQFTPPPIAQAPVDVAGSSMQLNASRSVSTGPEGPVLHNRVEEPAIPALSGDSAPIVFSHCPARTPTVLFQRIAADTHPISAIALPDSVHGSEGVLFATFGGAIAEQLSTNALFRQLSFTDAFVGAGYLLSQNSSVRVLAGEETFALSSTTQTISYQDTMFVHNGQSYANIIGEVQTSAGATSVRTYWLGASYRYSLGDAASFLRPFGEVMAGGATYGFISHQSLGAELASTSHVNVDVMLGLSELLPQGSSWLTKAGFAASISYRW